MNLKRNSSLYRELKSYQPDAGDCTKLSAIFHEHTINKNKLFDRKKHAIVG